LLLVKLNFATDRPSMAVNARKRGVNEAVSSQDYHDIAF